MHALVALDHSMRSLVMQSLPPSKAAVVEQMWLYIREQACLNAGYRWGSHLTRLSPEDAERVTRCFQEVVVGVEVQGFRLFPQTALNPLQLAMRGMFYDGIGSDTRPAWRNFPPEIVRAILIEHDSNLAAQAREELNAICRRIHEQLLAEPHNHDPEIVDMLVGHIIAMFPFFSPENNSEVSLLQKIGSEWELVDFHVSKLQLTADCVASPVYAYALTPIQDSAARPMLLFHGTPPVTVSGGLWCYLSDITPFIPVGQLIYSQGEAQITSWINQQNKIIEVFGISLGGALAYLVGRSHPDRVHLNAYVPPGMHFWTGGLHSIRGRTITHMLDPVHLLGQHPSGTDYSFLRSCTPEVRSRGAAHSRAPGGCGPTVLLRVNPNMENSRTIRKIITLVHQILSIPLFLLVGLIWAFARLLASATNFYRHAVDSCAVETPAATRLILPKSSTEVAF